MQIKVGIQNFQSITKAKLEFGNGITVITGASGSGKTAIMRALRCLVGNPSTSKQFIQDGKTESAVAILIDGFRRVDWRRTPGSSAYVLGATEVFSKTGRTRLHGVYPDFPLKWDEEMGKVVNFLTEWDVLFPFDRTPAALFSLFESIFQIEDTKGILEEMKKDETEAKSAEAAAQNLREQLLVKKLALEAFAVGITQDTVDQHLLAYRHTRDQLLGISESLEEVRTLDKYVVVGLDLKEGRIDFTPAEGLRALEQEDSVVAADLRVLGVARGLRSFVGDLGVLGELELLSRELESVQLEGAFVREADLLSRKDFVFSCVEELAPMEDDRRDLFAGERFIGVASGLEGLSITWEVFLEVFALEREMEQLGEGSRRLEYQLKDLEASLRKREEMQAALSKVETCPLCGSNLTKEHKHE